MPKIIENLEETIIETAKKQLFEKGYSRMTMRSVSTECNIAVGTVYNYYQSKDLLIAQIMLKDWMEIMSNVKLSCESSINIHEGFKIMFDGVSKFVDLYDVVWSQYGKTVYVRNDMPIQFNMLIKQLSDILAEVLKRCHNEDDPYISEFLAEILLNAATKKDFEYENLSRVLHRMFD